MPLFSSSFKVGPDAPSTPSSANAKASRQLEFDYTVPPDQYQGQAAVAGTALPGTDHQKQGDTQTSPLFRPTPSKDSHTNALGIEGSPSSSQGQGQTPSQPPPGRLQELGLQHRPSNASDHPFDDDTEDEDLGAGVRLGQARRKGSSVSLATLDLATVQEQEEDESTNGLPIPRDQAYTTPPPIISHPVSPFSPAVSALGDVPTPTSHQNSPYTRSPRSSTGASVTISHNKENMDRHSPPSSPGGGRLRVSASPGRHHHGLSALSPLQGLSPMQPVTRLPHTRSVSGDIKDTSSVKGKAGGHARTHSTGSGSLSRSLSRRQSMYNSADSWREGREYKDENLTNPAGLFSRLTLVKAPGEGKGLRQRSKSSSALAPMALAPIGISAPVDIPATSPRATRRSFASSFGAMSPITPVRPVPTAPSTATDATNRISSYGEDAQARGKNYTPDEVLDMARSLASPVLLPAGGLKGADLKRRKSAGASFGRSNQGLSMSSSLTTSSPSPETKSAALEPVEYVQLDDETLLPYVDRPSEVKELMDHPGNVKIFEMLRAAFPKQAARKEWKDIQPTEWFWDELVLHLATIDRIECPDYAWVLRARLAVRRRSVALWEKVGTCLGCDDRLLQAGAEDPDGGATWGGLEDDDYHSSFRGQVWIEGLSPVDPEEAERAERSFREEFGDIVEDDDAATAGMTALLGTIGEGDEGGSGTKQGGPKRQTPAQRAGSRHQRDPLLSPVKNTAPLPGISGSGGAAYSGSVESIGASPGVGGRRTQSRSKSFVGLTIHSGSITSPPSFSNAAGMGMGVGSFGGSTPGGMGISMGMGLGPGGRSPMFSPDAEMAMPTYDRGPGQALFPTGFASLSAEPNLGRAASGLVGGIRPQVVPSAFEYGHGGEGGSRLMRRKSGTGLSESAITFASESEWSAGAGHHD